MARQVVTDRHPDAGFAVQVSRDVYPCELVADAGNNSGAIPRDQEMTRKKGQEKSRAV